MGDEDVAQRSKRKLRLHELETDAVPGVDHVWYAVVDNEVGGRSWRVAAANRRTALRAEQHEPVRAKIGRTLLRECLPYAAAGYKAGAGSEKISSRDGPRHCAR